METVTKNRLMKNVSRHVEALDKLASYYDIDMTGIQLWKKLKFYENKLHKLMVYSCNGVGMINGVNYYNGTIDDYAKREYGYNVKSAYIEDDVTIFDVEAEKLENKLRELFPKLPFFVNGDARGYTLKLNEKTVQELQKNGINIQTDFGGYGILAPEFN